MPRTVQVTLDGREVPPRSDLVPCYVCGGWARSPVPASEDERVCYNCRRTRWNELGGASPDELLSVEVGWTE